MIKWRKIYLCVIAVLFAGLEVFGWYLGYTDRGEFFEGLGVLIYDMWLGPIILGILFGVFEATDCFDSKDLPIFEFSKNGFKKLGFSALRMLGVAVFHGVLAPILFVFSLDRLYDYFDMTGIILLWSVGLGLLAFLLIYSLSKLLFVAVRDIAKAHRTLKAADEDDD